MSDFNSTHNRVVWFDIPVADLDRAARFYNAVLAVPVTKHDVGGGVSLCVIHHEQGNGGCLVEDPEGITAKGPLLYLNVDGRIRAAEAEATKHGGKVLEPTVAIGPHGFRATVMDSEGNRVALHSNSDK